MGRSDYLPEKHHNWGGGENCEGGRSISIDIEKMKKERIENEENLFKLKEEKQIRWNEYRIPHIDNINTDLKVHIKFLLNKYLSGINGIKFDNRKQCFIEYIKVIDTEIFIKNCNIQPYKEYLTGNIVICNAFHIEKLKNRWYCSKDRLDLIEFVPYLYPET